MSKFAHNKNIWVLWGRLEQENIFTREGHNTTFAVVKQLYTQLLNKSKQNFNNFWIKFSKQPTIQLIDKCTCDLVTFHYINISLAGSNRRGWVNLVLRIAQSCCVFWLANGCFECCSLVEIIFSTFYHVFLSFSSDTSRKK